MTLVAWPHSGCILVVKTQRKMTKTVQKREFSFTKFWASKTASSQRITHILFRKPFGSMSISKGKVDIYNHFILYIMFQRRNIVLTFKINARVHFRLFSCINSHSRDTFWITNSFPRNFFYNSSFNFALGQKTFWMVFWISRKNFEISGLTTFQVSKYVELKIYK